MNAYILYKLYRQMQKVLNLPEDREDEIWKIEGGGMLFSVLKRMFKLIDRYCPPTTILILQIKHTDDDADPGKCTPWASCSG